MSLLHAFIFGGFVLILTYLGLKNPEGAGAVLAGSKVLSIDTIKAFQGRPVEYR